jgi:hypothetical protein
LRNQMARDTRVQDLRSCSGHAWARAEERNVPKLAHRKVWARRGHRPASSGVSWARPVV